jgi:hypothetical protein
MEVSEPENESWFNQDDRTQSFAVVVARFHMQNAIRNGSRQSGLEGWRGPTWSPHLQRIRAVERNSAPDAGGLELGCLFSINPDAHTVEELDLTSWGLVAARKGGISPSGSELLEPR